MPIYVFKCTRCANRDEQYRSLGDYTAYPCRRCGQDTEYIIVSPNISVWNAERKFPNIVGTGDGSASFPTKSAYEAHLKDNHIVEVDYGGKRKHPAGAKVTTYG